MTHPIDWPTVGPRLLEALERVANSRLESFHINPEGEPNIAVEGSDRFCHAHEVTAVLRIARGAIAAAKGDDQ